jgi:hypothetical protein
LLPSIRHHVFFNEDGRVKEIRPGTETAVLILTKYKFYDGHGLKLESLQSYVGLLEIFNDLIIEYPRSDISFGELAFLIDVQKPVNMCNTMPVPYRTQKFGRS